MKNYSKISSQIRKNEEEKTQINEIKNKLELGVVTKTHKPIKNTPSFQALIYLTNKFFERIILRNGICTNSNFQSKTCVQFSDLGEEILCCNEEWGTESGRWSWRWFWRFFVEENHDHLSGFWWRWLCVSGDEDRRRFSYLLDFHRL